MKKIYITIFTLVLSHGIFAQNFLQEKINSPADDTDRYELTHILNPFVTSTAIAASPIWQEDFAGGFPSDWTTYTANSGFGNGGTAASPPNIATCPWKHSMQGSWGYWNSEPKDANNNPANASAAINSTTASNGFLISDIDSANHWSGGGALGTSSGSSSGSTYHYLESYFTTSVIDLSLYPAVSLEFEQKFRYNNLGSGTPSLNPPTVYVSSDSINWTPFLVNGSTSGPVPNNTNSTDPDKKIINITSVAGGQSTVYLRFGWEARVYFWMIDDIRIIETPRNLIEIEDIVIGGWHLDYQNYSVSGLIPQYFGLDYTIKPNSQLANNPFMIEGILRNRGYADQNSTLNYEVSGSGSYSGSSVPSTVPAYSSANTIDSVIVGTTPLSPSIGTYSVAIWGESDSSGVITAISDTVYKNIEVSDYIYGKDLGSSTPGSYILGGTADQNHIITRYEMYANEQLYSIRAYISDQSDVGAEIKAIIYEFDSTAANGRLLIDESDNYLITAQDLGAWVDIPFVSPISLLSGYAYSCGIVGFQHPTDSSFIGVSGQAMYNGEHSLFDELGLSTQSAGAPTWYYITSTPMIRMNFDPASASAQTFDCNGVSCIDPGNGNGAYSSLSACQANCPPSAIGDQESNISIYPNPTNGVFVIELDAIEGYDVNIYNVLGQSVLSTFTNTMFQTIDLSIFDKGIYTVELKDEKTIYIKKLIVK